jgi:hypothetical protein
MVRKLELKSVANENLKKCEADRSARQRDVTCSENDVTCYANTNTKPSTNEARQWDVTLKNGGSVNIKRQKHKRIVFTYSTNKCSD